MTDPLTIAQVVPFLQSVIASGERLSNADVAAIERALAGVTVGGAYQTSSHDCGCPIEEGCALAAPPPPRIDPERLDESGPDLVFSTSPAPDGIDTDCFFIASPDRISVHVSRRAINAQIVRKAADEGSAT